MPPALYQLIDGFRRLIRRQDGQDLFEYALIVAVVALGLITAFQSVANDVYIVYQAVIAALNSVVT